MSPYSSMSFKYVSEQRERQARCGQRRFLLFFLHDTVTMQDLFFFFFSNVPRLFLQTRADTNQSVDVNAIMLRRKKKNPSQPLFIDVSHYSYLKPMRNEWN